MLSFYLTNLFIPIFIFLTHKRSSKRPYGATSDDRVETYCGYFPSYHQEDHLTVLFLTRFPPSGLSGSVTNFKNYQIASINRKFLNTIISKNLPPEKLAEDLRELRLAEKNGRIITKELNINLDLAKDEPLFIFFNEEISIPSASIAKNNSLSVSDFSKSLVRIYQFAFPQTSPVQKELINLEKIRIEYQLINDNGYYANRRIGEYFRLKFSLSSPLSEESTSMIKTHCQTCYKYCSIDDAYVDGELKKRNQEIYSRLIEDKLSLFWCLKFFQDFRIVERVVHGQKPRYFGEICEGENFSNGLRNHLSINYFENDSSNHIHYTPIWYNYYRSNIENSYLSVLPTLYSHLTFEELNNGEENIFTLKVEGNSEGTKELTFINKIPKYPFGKKKAFSNTSLSDFRSGTSGGSVVPRLTTLNCEAVGSENREPLCQVSPNFQTQQPSAQGVNPRLPEGQSLSPQATRPVPSQFISPQGNLAPQTLEVHQGMYPHCFSGTSYPPFVNNQLDHQKLFFDMQNQNQFCPPCYACWQAQNVPGTPAPSAFPSTSHLYPSAAPLTFQVTHPFPQALDPNVSSDRSIQNPHLFPYRNVSWIPYPQPFRPISTQPIPLGTTPNQSIQPQPYLEFQPVQNWEFQHPR